MRKKKDLILVQLKLPATEFKKIYELSEFSGIPMATFIRSTLMKVMQTSYPEMLKVKKIHDSEVNQYKLYQDTQIQI